MKKILLAALLSATPLLGIAADEYAPQEFDFSSLASEPQVAYGTVESVREVPLRRELSELTEVFELSMRPETGEELVVRLDDGRTISVVHDGLQRFVEGQRVRVVPQRGGARLEHS
jgi:outer membrane lipoprotein SlyB